MTFPSDRIVDSLINLLIDSDCWVPNKWFYLPLEKRMDIRRRAAEASLKHLVDYHENIGLYLKRFLQLLHARNSHPGSDFACIDPFCSSLSGTIQEIAAYIKMGEEKKESKL